MQKQLEEDKLVPSMPQKEKNATEEDKRDKSYETSDFVRLRKCDGLKPNQTILKLPTLD